MTFWSWYLSFSFVKACWNFISPILSKNVYGMRWNLICLKNCGVETTNLVTTVEVLTLVSAAYSSVGPETSCKCWSPYHRSRHSELSLVVGHQIICKISSASSSKANIKEITFSTTVNSAAAAAATSNCLGLLVHNCLPSKVLYLLILYMDRSWLSFPEHFILYKR